jgi:predicted TIM-barrel fold metal-dependent hydrolase
MSPAGEKIPLFSADDHLIEPPELWQKRLPQKFRERGPRCEFGGGKQIWHFEDRQSPVIGLQAMAGRKVEDYTATAITYDDMRPGCYDPVARLADLDEDGVVGSVCFPSFPGLCGNAFIRADDKELGLACIQAYNDWNLEEWCAAAPHRYVPLMILPLWDAELSARELRRTVDNGAKAFCFTEFPHKLGLPSVYDDAWTPLWEAANEMRVPALIHIGSSISSAADMAMDFTPGAPAAVFVTNSPLSSFYAASDLLWCPVLSKYEHLKFVMSEGGIGWVPYLLERADYTWERHRFWTQSTHMKEKPSHYFKRSIFVCFIDDIVGIEQRHTIGVENILWESDYPHTDTTWPNSQQVVQKHLGHLPEEDLRKITYENAARLFQMQPVGV